MASVRAVQSFHAAGRSVSAGDVFDAKDPIVKGREALFESDGVEQATAAPGEKRSTPRRTPRPKS